MSETKQPDWDKITEGKIRHGFAVAAFTNGMNMTDELCTQIECWVRYVVDGKSTSGNGSVTNSAFEKTEKTRMQSILLKLLRIRLRL